jgi:hypothetical protein
LETIKILNQPVFDRLQYFSEEEICQCFAILTSDFRRITRNAKIILFHVNNKEYEGEELRFSAYYMRKRDLQKFVDEMLKT